MPSLRSIAVLLSILILTGGAVLPVLAANGSSSPTLPQVTFNHLENRFTSPPVLRLRNGQVFEIRIEQTSSPDFKYDVAGIKIEKEGKEAGVNKLPLSSLDTKGLWVRHEEQFAGYVVKIQRDEGGLAVADTSGTPIGSLEPTEFIVQVDTVKVDYEISGAFTASRLRDPKFSLVENNEGKKIVTEDKNARDQARLGVGAFIHLFDTRWPCVALTFGMGINDGSRTTYFVGPSLRFGDKGALTAGFALGSIDRLPSGAHVNQPAPDDNVLSNLGTRNVGKVFLALSYTFLNPGVDSLKKPFAGSGSEAEAGSTGEGSGSGSQKVDSAKGKAEDKKKSDDSTNTVGNEQKPPLQ